MLVTPPLYRKTPRLLQPKKFSRKSDINLSIYKETELGLKYEYIHSFTNITLEMNIECFIIFIIVILVNYLYIVTIRKEIISNRIAKFYSP